MINFIALDFETATGERNSACELGICIVENGNITETKSWLIKPPSYPYFNPYNVAVHGISPEDVKDAPTFAEVWEEVQEILYGNLMIAHNASFDAGVLRSCLEHNGFYKPKMNYLCSISLAKKSWKNMRSYGLKNLANAHQISFTHHRAGADAEVCAKLSMLAFDSLMITRNEEIKSLLKLNIKVL